MDFTARKQTLGAQNARLSGAVSGAVAESARSQPDASHSRQGLAMASAWPDPVAVAGPAATGVVRAEDLRQVEAARARLREGSDGFCQICGDEIGADLLDQSPHTPFCKSCAP